jgi:hypothetical protein
LKIINQPVLWILPSFEKSSISQCCGFCPALKIINQPVLWILPSFENHQSASVVDSAQL